MHQRITDAAAEQMREALDNHLLPGEVVTWETLFLPGAGEDGSPMLVGILVMATPMMDSALAATFAFGDFLNLDQDVTNDAVSDCLRNLREQRSQLLERAAREATQGGAALLKRAGQGGPPQESSGPGSLFLPSHRQQ